MSSFNERQPAVYILASHKNGTLYTGVTSDLARRIFEHRNRQSKGFSSKYRVYRLVHVEFYEDMYSAICREKQIKRWKRQWKLELFEKTNPFWNDLYETLI